MTKIIYNWNGKYLSVNGVNYIFPLHPQILNIHIYNSSRTFVNNDFYFFSEFGIMKIILRNEESVVLYKKKHS